MVGGQTAETIGEKTENVGRRVVFFVDKSRGKKRASVVTIKYTRVVLTSYFSEF